MAGTMVLGWFKLSGRRTERKKISLFHISLSFRLNITLCKNGEKCENQKGDILGFQSPFASTLQRIPNDAALAAFLHDQSY